MNLENDATGPSIDSLLRLHHHPHFQDQCVELLNSEWPRSKAARVHSLEKSCDDLPTSLLLVKNGLLVGYSCLCAVPGRSRDCLIQSVVVDQRFRRQGFGRLLMLASERYANEKFGFETMYLSTHDQVPFYTRLGYETCEPILHVGANAKLLASGAFRKFTSSVAPKLTTNSTAETGRIPAKEMVQNICECRASGAVPPPPPPPQLPKFEPNDVNSPVQVFMKKKIS